MSNHAYNYDEAAAEVGVSKDLIMSAVKNSDLAVKYVNSKPIILAESLRLWLDALPSEKPSKAVRS